MCKKWRKEEKKIDDVFLSWPWREKKRSIDHCTVLLLHPFCCFDCNMLCCAPFFWNSICSVLHTSQSVHISSSYTSSIQILYFILWCVFFSSSCRWALSLSRWLYAFQRNLVSLIILIAIHFEICVVFIFIFLFSRFSYASHILTLSVCVCVFFLVLLLLLNASAATWINALYCARIKYYKRKISFIQMKEKRATLARNMERREKKTRDVCKNPTDATLKSTFFPVSTPSSL